MKPLHSNYLKPWLSSLRCCVQETKLHSPLAMNRAHKIECKLRSGDGTGFVRLSSSNQASFETKNKTATSQQLFNSLLDLICSIIYQLYEATLLCYQKTTNPISKKFTILYLPKVKNCWKITCNQGTTLRYICNHLRNSFSNPQRKKKKHSVLTEILRTMCIGKIRYQLP